MLSVTSGREDQTPGIVPISGLPQPRRALRVMLSLAGVAVDLLALIAAFVTANLLRFDDALHEQGLILLLAVLPLYYLLATSTRAFGIGNLIRWRLGVRRALASLIVAIVVVLLVVYFVKAGEGVSRAVFGTGLLLSCAFLTMARAFWGWNCRRLLGDNPMSQVVILDGVDMPRDGDALFVDAARHGLYARLDDPQAMDRLGQLVSCVDRVIVACPAARRSDWARTLKGADVGVEIIAPELDMFPLGMGRYRGRSTLRVGRGALSLQDRAMKRVLDLSIVTLAAPVVLPVMILVALAIRLESHGPVIFVQYRIGRNSRMFRMYKFRSMRVESSDHSGRQSTRRDDDRITRVGRFIRRTSLDELPQLLNVFLGDMSVVGPRPHAVASTADNRLFWDIDARYWQRHAMKPGLTGLAQVRGHRGATARTADLSNRLQSDLEYLADWTVLKDLAIIFATFRVLFHPNAF